MGAAFPASTEPNDTQHMAAELIEANKRYGDAAMAQDAADSQFRRATRNMMVPTSYLDGKIRSAVEYPTFIADGLLSGDYRSRARAELIRQLIFDGMTLDDSVCEVKKSDAYCDEVWLDIQVEVTALRAKHRLDELEADLETASAECEAALDSLIKAEVNSLADVAAKVEGFGAYFDMSYVDEDVLESLMPKGFRGLSA